MISGWWRGSTIAPMVFEGYCNTELVCEWIEQLLLPELLPGQIIIIDNASFHPKERIKKLLAKAGCEVLFLPAYSPALNKIEKFFVSRLIVRNPQNGVICRKFPHILTPVIRKVSV